MSQGIELPSHNFGPAAMCVYCGSLWNTMDHTTRISRGIPLSKSIRKIVRSMNNDNKRVPKVRRSLAEKCLKNRTNKLVLKCSVCSNSTQISLDKPQREKIDKIDTESIRILHKRKKRRAKDRTAGLNISGITNVNAGDVVEGSKETNTKKGGSTPNFIATTQKLKKLNINRLKDIVNRGATPPKMRSLHNFLTELC